jgi:hypothetical protein
MAQAMLVQEQALATLQSRVQQLEQQPAQQQPAGGGGFLSSIFGGGQSAPARPQRPAYQQQQGLRSAGHPAEHPAPVHAARLRRRHGRRLALGRPRRHGRWRAAASWPAPMQTAVASRAA